MNLQKLKQRLKGRWRDVLIAAGIGEEFLTGKHTPCPVCGGKDRFRFDDKDGEGTFFCNQCQPQAGDGFALLQKKFGYNFGEILEEVEELLWNLSETPVNNVPYKKPADPKIALNSVWQSAKELTVPNPVTRYLKARKIVLQPKNVRFSLKCYEPDSRKDFIAMIAKVVNKDDTPICVHRTYLETTLPQQAAIAEPKKFMPGTEPLMGSAIRLFQPGAGEYPNDILGIAEGIETAISATQLFKVATWAVGNTALMEKWLPPEEYKQILIFGDNDSNFAGQKAAMILASRLVKLGILVVVKFPEKADTDYNDVLIEQFTAKKRENRNG